MRASTRKTEIESPPASKKSASGTGAGNVQHVPPDPRQTRFEHARVDGFRRDRSRHDRGPASETAAVDLAAPRGAATPAAAHTRRVVPATQLPRPRPAGALRRRAPFAVGLVVHDDRRAVVRAAVDDGGRVDHMGNATRCPFDFVEVNAIPVDLDDEVAASGKEDASVAKPIAEIPVANGRANGRTRALRASQYPLASIVPATRISPRAPSAGFPWSRTPSRRPPAPACRPGRARPRCGCRDP